MADQIATRYGILDRKYSHAALQTIALTSAAAIDALDKAHQRMRRMGLPDTQDAQPPPRQRWEQLLRNLFPTSIILVDPHGGASADLVDLPPGSDQDERAVRRVLNAAAAFLLAETNELEDTIELSQHWTASDTLDLAPDLDTVSAMLRRVTRASRTLLDHAESGLWRDLLAAHVPQPRTPPLNPRVPIEQIEPAPSAGSSRQAPMLFLFTGIGKTHNIPWAGGQVYLELKARRARVEALGSHLMAPVFYVDRPSSEPWSTGSMDLRTELRPAIGSLDLYCCGWRLERPVEVSGSRDPLSAYVHPWNYHFARFYESLLSGRQARLFLSQDVVDVPRWHRWSRLTDNPSTRAMFPPGTHPSMLDPLVDTHQSGLLHIRSLGTSGGKTSILPGVLSVLEWLGRSHPRHRQAVVNVLSSYLRAPSSRPEVATRSGACLNDAHRYPDTDTNRLIDVHVDSLAWRSPDRRADEPWSLSEVVALLGDDGIQIPPNVRVAAQPALLVDDAGEERGRAEVQSALTALLRMGRDPQLDDTHTPDLDLDLTNAVLKDFTLTGCRIRTTRFAGARFYGDTTFDNVQFDDASFDDAVFEGHLRFAQVQFAGGTRFGRTTFQKDTVFQDATFNQGVRFDTARFAGPAVFVESMFNEDARFHATQFAGDALFDRVTFTGLARFGQSRFLAGVRFVETRFRRAQSPQSRWNLDTVLLTDEPCWVRADGLAASSTRRVWPAGWTVRLTGEHPAGEPAGRWGRLLPDDQPPTTGMAAAGVIPPARQHAANRVIVMTRVEVVQELKCLRRGRGLNTSSLIERVGPELRRVCGVLDEDSPAVVRSKMVLRLAKLCDQLPEDLRAAANAALSLYNDRDRLYADRVNRLARHFRLDSRTARRRVDTALQLLAHLIVEQDSSSDDVYPDDPRFNLSEAWGDATERTRDPHVSGSRA